MNMDNYSGDPSPPNVPEVLPERWARLYKPGPDGSVHVPLANVVIPELDLKLGLIDDSERNRPILSMVECAVYRDGQYSEALECNPREFPLDQIRDLPVVVQPL